MNVTQDELLASLNDEHVSPERYVKNMDVEDRRINVD